VAYCEGELSKVTMDQAQPHRVATSPFGSQKEVAGTRPCRSLNDRFQVLLVRILSSRTFVTDRGAQPFCTSKAPAHRDDLAFTIVRAPHNGCDVAREDCARGFKCRSAVVRDAEVARDGPSLPT
jgi:hypothetical protein